METQFYMIIKLILLLNLIYLGHTQEPYEVNEIKCADDRLPENCHEVHDCLNNIYTIKVSDFSDSSFHAVCDLKTASGGWTIIQRRMDGSENFFRDWDDYVQGFGHMNGEFFLGLNKIHHLTTQGKPQELYIILEDFEGKRKHARYHTFRVDSESTQYKLHLGEYSGDAGDSFGKHNGHTFSTRDHGHTTECAQKYKGGWWYHECHECNLNGLYLDGQFSKSEHAEGVIWSTFRGYDYSLKFVQMMIRPK